MYIDNLTIGFAIIPIKIYIPLCGGVVSLPNEMWFSLFLVNINNNVSRNKPRILFLPPFNFHILYLAGIRILSDEKWLRFRPLTLESGIWPRLNKEILAPLSSSYHLPIPFFSSECFFRLFLSALKEIILCLLSIHGEEREGIFSLTSQYSSVEFMDRLILFQFFFSISRLFYFNILKSLLPGLFVNLHHLILLIVKPLILHLILKTNLLFYVKKHKIL